MLSLVKKVADIFVFRNVWISVAAVCLVGETRLLSGLQPFVVDAFIVFIFFSTFLVYNFHVYSNYLGTDYSIVNVLRNLGNAELPLISRICVAIGMLGSIVAFVFLKLKMMFLLLPVAVITLAYTLPLLKLEKKAYRLREIAYVKIFTVAVMWTVATALLPLFNDFTRFSHPDDTYALLLIVGRCLFIYAITIPFEIRDRHEEMSKGIRTIPGLYGEKKSKMLAYIILLFYGLVITVREYGFGGIIRHHPEHVFALLLTALTAAFLIYHTGDHNGRYYFKFWIDGTMVEQFILLILFQYYA